MNVGRGVSEGGAVGVSVGGRVRVAGTGWNGEGVGLVVQVGSKAGVGEGCAIKLSPPHPRDKRVPSAMAIKDFFKSLERMIEIPNDTQSIQGQPRRDDLYHICFLRNDRRQTAGCNNLHFHAKLFTKTFHHPLHHAHITE